MKKRVCGRMHTLGVSAAFASFAATAALAMPNFGDWSAPANIESLPSSSTEINHPSIDGCASISPDGLTLAFNSFRTGNQQIYMATRGSTSEGFGDPVMLPEPVNGPGLDYCPMIGRGKRLYFTSGRDGDPGDIFVTRHGPNGWSEPQRLGPNINIPGVVEEGASIYEDSEGREVLLFSRRSATAFTGLGGKIYQSIDGAPATLVEGGPNGVSSAGDNRPSVSHDGKTIFWDSHRTGTLGGADIWYATRSSTSQPWGQAQQLAALNTSQNDTRPYVSWNGESMIISAANDIWIATRTKNPGN